MCSINPLKFTAKSLSDANDDNVQCFCRFDDPRKQILVFNSTTLVRGSISMLDFEVGE